MRRRYISKAIIKMQFKATARLLQNRSKKEKKKNHQMVVRMLRNLITQTSLMVM